MEGPLERELIEQARRGDRAAYEQIVRRKVETVYRTARAILGNNADADDATRRQTERRAARAMLRG
jgi:DNA-directed RNA polymerase specialized sigma24 family protein